MNLLIKKPLLFTLPGKIGDNLFRLPVVYQYCKQHNIKADVCLDENSKCLMSVIKNQDYINDAFVSDGVVGYPNGGQPYDFGKDEEFKKEYETVIHLGIKNAPYHENLTLNSCYDSGIGIDTTNLLIEPCIKATLKPIRNLCIHTKTFTQRMQSESEEAILSVLNQLIPIFDNIYIIAKESDREYYSKFFIHEKIAIFDDGGDLNRTINLLSESVLLGTYGSMWALASCIKSKQVVVGDRWNICNLWGLGPSDYEDEKWYIYGDPIEELTKLIFGFKKYEEFHGEKFYGMSIDESLREYFPDYEFKGVFFDIGAFEPINISNSYHFEKNGWDTYCFEANPNLMPELKKYRTNVYNYALADTIKNEPVPFHVFEAFGGDGSNVAGISSLNVDQEHYETMKDFIKNSYDVLTSQTTLNHILDTELKQISKIDVMSIDIDGGELDFLKGFDIDKYKPTIIVIENFHARKSIYDYFMSHGYFLDKKVDYNEYYTRDNLRADKVDSLESKPHEEFHGQFDPRVDSVIREYFKDYNYKGVFIDIGADKAIEDNNSYHFEKNGWDCYCIEANPISCDKLKAERSKVINYAMSDFDKDNVEFEVIKLGSYNMGACSGLRVDERVVEAHKHLLSDRYKILINVRKLDTLLSHDISVDKIDVVSIDTEGTELDVLKGFDIIKWNPKLIICENNFDTNECRDYLKTLGYKLDQRSFINDFFVKE